MEKREEFNGVKCPYSDKECTAALTDDELEELFGGKASQPAMPVVGTPMCFCRKAGPVSMSARCISGLSACPYYEDCKNPKKLRGIVPKSKA